MPEAFAALAIISASALLGVRQLPPFAQRLTYAACTASLLSLVLLGSIWPSVYTVLGLVSLPAVAMSAWSIRRPAFASSGPKRIYVLTCAGVAALAWLVSLLWLSGPDPDSAPDNVLTGFDRHLDSDRASYATRLLLNRHDRASSQVTYHVAGSSTRLWISTFWSPSQQLAVIAQRAYFGHGFFGIESAALGYFGRGSAELSKEEVAALALLTPAPSALSPWCNRARFEKRVARVPAFAALDAQTMLANLRPAPADACEPDRPESKMHRVSVIEDDVTTDQSQ